MTITNTILLTTSNVYRFGILMRAENLKDQLLPFPQEGEPAKKLARRRIQVNINKSLVTWLIEVVLEWQDVVVKATIENDSSANSRRYVRMKTSIENHQQQVLQPVEKELEHQFKSPSVLTKGVVLVDSLMLVMEVNKYLQEQRDLSVNVTIDILSPNETMIEEPTKHVIGKKAKDV